VEGGTFKMGSVFYDLDEEKHKVYVSTFNMQVTEVSQGLYQAVMGENPSANKTNANFPVTNVSWEDCQRFIEKLNQITGKTYRLPTEAEWEYAAHGGQLGHGYLFSGSDTLSNVAWYLKNSGNVIHEVQLKAPNELGLYDMSGNVWEWCLDWYGRYSRKKKNPRGPETGTYRVFRGGSWGRDASGCRVTYRCRWEPNRSNAYLGFRLVLE
jgi:formylglycine-generating enzyme required for sulfatase activity